MSENILVVVDLNTNIPWNCISFLSENCSLLMPNFLESSSKGLLILSIIDY